jgi:hypothetical protein
MASSPEAATQVPTLYDTGMAAAAPDRAHVVLCSQVKVWRHRHHPCVVFLVAGIPTRLAGSLKQGDCFVRLMMQSVQLCQHAPLC